MKIRDKIEETIKSSQELEKDRAELLSLLKKKKAELDGLAVGIDKYKNDPKLSESMKKILLQKHKELKEIRVRVDELEANYKEVKAEMKKLYALVNKRQKAAAVKIAVSPASEKAIEEALSVKLPEKVVKEELKPAPKKEAKIEPAPRKTAPKKDLYEQAASEARAQEEFLRSQSRRSYGNI